MATFRLLAGGSTAADDTPAWRQSLDRSLATWGLTAGLVLVVVDLGRLWHQTYAFWGGFEPITMELMGDIANSTTWGAGWKMQLGLAMLATVAIAAASRVPALTWWPAALLAAASAWARPLTGHAVEEGSWLSLPAILQGIHVVAASLWIGTLFVLVFVGLRSARSLPNTARARLTADLVARFSPLALGSVVGLFIAGAATSFMYLGGFDAVYGTRYGQVLAAKVLAFAGVAAMGYYNWQRVRPQLELAAQAEEVEGTAADALIRAARAELLVAALVLVATAILVVLPMPMG